MQTITLEADLRETTAKSANKNLRKLGFVPAVLYHKGDETLAIAVKEIPLRKLIYTTESHIVNLKLSNGTEQQAILKQTDFDPLSDKVIHVDFLSLKSDEPVDIEVPTLFKGTPAGAIKGGRVQVIMHKVMVRCLPADIPEHIEFDLTPLDLSQSFHIGDANKFAGDNAKYRVLGDEKLPVVSIVSLTKAEEPVAVAAVAAAEPEVIKKGKKDEEAAPAADAKAPAKKK
ncbi:MAG: 50S ribosomal protein L25 [Rhizobacter sp.]|nr:50S ribosomal protein L25 [Chlorobiales bacterium]